MNTLNFRLIGISPLLMHNGEGANPLNPLVRQLNVIAKKGRGLKDEETLMKIARMEWLIGVYSKKGIVGIPHHVIFTTIRNGARAYRKGKDVEAGVFVTDFFPLEYDGPKEVEKLLDYTNGDGGNPFMDQRMVGISRNKVLRTRPYFEEWELPIWFTVDPSVIEPKEIQDYIETAGIRNGIGDGRSLGFGRFKVEEV